MTCEVDDYEILNRVLASGSERLLTRFAITMYVINSVAFLKCTILLRDGIFKLQIMKKFHLYDELFVSLFHSFASTK